MSSVPAAYRGAASGMRATFQNAGMMMSMGIFFTIVISNMAAHLPRAVDAGLLRFGLPATFAAGLAKLPPTGALFAALLGYNPMAHLLPASVLHRLPAAKAAALVGEHFFPSLIEAPFASALHVVFLFSALMSATAAGASLLRGKWFVYEEEAAPAGAKTEGPGPGAQLVRTPEPTAERLGESCAVEP